MTKRWDIDSIKQANADAGRTWFGSSEMEFFSSRIESGVYQGVGGIYFVTSEKFEHPSDNRYDGPRLYSVRRFDPETGGVGTAGSYRDFQQKRMAAQVASALARGEME